jgi:hypothetical protein
MAWLVENDLDEFALVGFILKPAIQQGFRVTAYGRQRCSQLMRDVGHKLLAGLLLALNIGDIVQGDDGAAPSFLSQRQGARVKPAARRARQAEQISFRLACLGDALQNIAQHGFSYNLI